MNQHLLRGLMAFNTTSVIGFYFYINANNEFLINQHKLIMTLCNSSKLTLDGMGQLFKTLQDKGLIHIEEENKIEAVQLK
jgi:Na+/alanine symporter